MSDQHWVLFLNSLGVIKSFKLNHKISHILFDCADIQFCGAIDEFNAIAICRKKPRDTDQVNFFSEKFPEFFDKCFGDILLVGSDNNGDACDLNIAELNKLLHAIR